MFYEDPLAKYAVALPDSVVKYANWLGYTLLPDHLHEVFIFLGFYTFIYYLSPILSPFFIGKYRQLDPRTRVNFDMHVVSQVQAIFLCTASFPLFFDKNLPTLTSSTPYAQFVCASATGYFVWDVVVSLKHVKMFGMGFLAHAVAALFVFSNATRPFMLSYSAPFMWYEASTPFVNNHWFASHIPGLFSDKFQMINGLCLVVVFFFSRLVAGPINGYSMFKEVFTNPPQTVPFWVVTLVLASYLILSALNVLWFSKMISLALKQLKKKKPE